MILTLNTKKGDTKVKSTRRGVLTGPLSKPRDLDSQLLTPSKAVSLSVKWGYQ